MNCRFHQLPSRCLTASVLNRTVRGVLFVMMQVVLVVLLSGWSQAQQTVPGVQGSDVQVVPASERVPTPLEQKVKAAYLYNFSRYFDWPDEAFGGPNEPFVIGVLGKDPLGHQLDKLAKKKSVKNRKIIIKRFATMDDFQSCHLLFVSRSVTDEQFQVSIERTRLTSILVVSERPVEDSQGSAVQLFVDETDTVGFEIDVDIVNARSLQVSAKLLKLARVSESRTSSK